MELIRQVKHAHVELAEAQRVQKTLLCPGPCPHMFDGLEENRKVYGNVRSGEAFEYYEALLGLTSLPGKRSRKNMAGLLAGAEDYTKMMIQIWTEVCGLWTFKDQDGVYQGWGPPGDFMMMRVVDFARAQEKKLGSRIILQHDCKRGDLGATMYGYFTRFIGDLQDKLGFKHSFLPYDTMNIQVYMGQDVAMLKEAKKKNVIPPLGLKLMKEKGKGVVVVCKTSNDSWEDYQMVFGDEPVYEKVALDVAFWSSLHMLDYDGLSALGLVVGSTAAAKGRIRLIFPTGTLWVPGFGNQGGNFANIMLELIRDGKWNGQGAIFCSETAMMYAWMEKFGGTGRISDAEKCAKAAISAFRQAEELAYQAPNVVEAGIRYPFN